MIKSFTEKFLTYSRVTLFILFLMAGFSLYSSSTPVFDYITIVVNVIGGISFLAWLYAVGNKANERLQKQNITLEIFKYFNIGFIIIIGSVLAMFFLSNGYVSSSFTLANITYHLSYTKPLVVALLFLASLLFTIIVAAKILVSAEHNKEAAFEEYFTTILMFAISWIGLWFIQPRAQKL